MPVNAVTIHSIQHGPAHDRVNVGPKVLVVISDEDAPKLEKAGAIRILGPVDEVPAPAPMVEELGDMPNEPDFAGKFGRRNTR